MTDSNGHADFAVNLASTTIAGELVTATATDAAGNTSEFSDAFMATGWVLERPVELLIGGGVFHDVIGITQGSLIVTINGFTFMFEDDGQSELTVNLLSGNDRLISTVANNTTVYGGDRQPICQSRQWQHVPDNRWKFAFDHRRYKARPAARITRSRLVLRQSGG